MSFRSVLCAVLLYSFLLNGKEHKNDSFIKINGELSLVYFNDGDTFRVNSGKYKGERVRLQGYNSLESYGPVHQWADFSKEELFENAKNATKFAQNGLWECETNKERDTYGRLLAFCHDLAKGLIKNGLAHAYSATENKADDDYLALQRYAQTNKLGMWKKGAPNYIITSLHSALENSKNYAKDNKNYNRMISTVDGHSKKWHHKEIYKTCEKVCLLEAGSCMVYVPSDERFGDNKADCLR